MIVTIEADKIIDYIIARNVRNKNSFSFIFSENFKKYENNLITWKTKRDDCLLWHLHDVNDIFIEEDDHNYIRKSDKFDFSFDNDEEAFYFKMKYG